MRDRIRASIGASILKQQAFAEVHNVPEAGTPGEEAKYPVEKKVGRQILSAVIIAKRNRPISRCRLPA